MALNIGAMMTRKREDVDFPKPLPPGVYYGTIVGRPKFSDAKVSEKTGKEFVMVNFPIALEAPGPGVDGDMLVAAGGLVLKSGEPKTIEHGIYVADDTEFRVWLFLESFFGKGNVADWHSAFDALVGRKVQVVLEHRLRDQKDVDSNWHFIADKGVIPMDS